MIIRWDLCYCYLVSQGLNKVFFTSIDFRTSFPALLMKLTKPHLPEIHDIAAEKKQNDRKLENSNVVLLLAKTWRGALAVLILVMPSPTLRTLLSGTFLQKEGCRKPVLGVWPSP